MPGQRIDWDRARHPKYVEEPSAEISYRAALEDQQVLDEIAERERKQRKAAYRKLPRSLSKRHAIAQLEKAHSRPDRADELRLSTILGGQQFGHFPFEREPYLPLTDRSFVCRTLRLRVIIDGRARGNVMIVRPGRRKKFTDVQLTISSEAVTQSGGMVAAYIREICGEQERLRSGRSAVE
jgi:hypothetical protein